MVISNEAYLKKMNIDKMPSSSDIDYIIETNDIVDFAAKEKDMALDFLIENFYDLFQIRSIGGENDMHYVICRLCSLFYFNQDKKNSIKNFMNSLSSANKKKIFEKYEPYIDNAALALTPECAFDDTIATTITAVVSDNTIKKTFTGLLQDYCKVTAQYVENTGDIHRCFDIYKKEILDECPYGKGRLLYVLRFLYVQFENNGGCLEKKAVDYMMDISGYNSVFLNKLNEIEILKTRREAKNWLKNHRRAKNFLELSLIKSEESKQNIDLIYRLISILGFDYTSVNVNLDLPSIEQVDIQKILALLNRYSNIKDNDEIKNLLIYLYYAFYPIILQGKLYNSEYLKLRVKTEEANLKHSEEIDKLKLKSAPLNSIIDQKQDSLNKIQIQYNRLKSSSDKEIERLKAELEKQKQINQELTKHIELLQQINEDLENKLDEFDTSSDNNEEIESLVPNKDIQDKLKSLNILIMGGHQIWQNKLKELYPYFNYIDSENVNFDINIVRNADIVLFNTLHCSHSLYYKMKNNVNNGRMDCKDKVFYISSNNLVYFKNLVTDTISNKKSTRE